MWTYNNVKNSFVDFFQKHNHTHIPSSSVVPSNDKSLLFTNSGMVQFKNIFIGTEQPITRRACNIQGCIRAGGKHCDLDDVGKDSYHHTFFEMAGNWSFNYIDSESTENPNSAYFKDVAIDMAWKLLVDEYKLDVNSMYVTYFGGCAELGLQPDIETKQLWQKYLPEHRILPFGMKENFWEMGYTGPCGPCTEIHYDKSHIQRDSSNLVNKDDPTVIEIWNLVFMQYRRLEDGSVIPLQMKHVDTGAGVERLTAVLQNCTNYQIDIFNNVMDIIFNVFEKNTKITNKQTPQLLQYVDLYGQDDPKHVNTAYRVIADHVRTMIFALSDGVVPEATDKGYVVRRLIRRALRYCTKIQESNLKEGILSEIVSEVYDLLVNKYNYVVLESSLIGKDKIVNIVQEEELKFGKVMKKGLKMFKTLIKKNNVGMNKLFELYTTFGFPVDIIKQLCEESNIEFRTEDFNLLMREHIEKSKK